MTHGTNSLLIVEEECAAGRTAPRVSLDDITNAIEAVFYCAGSEILEVSVDTPYTDDQHDKAGLLTICLVMMKNGFTIVGKSAPASADNYDPILGRKLAYDDAVQQIWPLMGFALKQYVFETGPYGEVEQDFREADAG